MGKPADTKNDTQERLMVLRQLIREGDASTQEELCEALEKKGFEVTQSTVSRDLRRIGAMKTTNSDGEIIYRLPEDRPLLPPMVVNHSLEGLLTDIESNKTLVVVHTTPGSASLIARHLDSMRLALGIMGTIAGDDTILVVPIKEKDIAEVVQNIKDEFY